MTGLLLAFCGLLAVWAGGWWFAGLVIGVAGLLIWEVARLFGGAPQQAIALGALGSLAVLSTTLLPPGLALPLVMAVGLVGIALLEAERALFVLLAAAILLAAFGLILHREAYGLLWMLWIVMIVISTDILGYFVGRAVGGPKFWPAVSPKKTWSGTIAGWIGAAAIGAGFMAQTGAGVELVGISVALSMASQMGDIGESAVKRHVGVKDSSSLLPGHGGVFDRFDGMIGAALVLMIVQSVTVFPPQPL